jgi:tetratricopeptide (TPR) repeat protein
MPAAPTEIPHLAFTHHRIGIHPPRPAAGPPGREGLVPFLALDGLSKADRERSFGMGYMEAAGRSADPGRADRFRRAALDRLTGLAGVGLRDPVVDVALARLRFELGLAGPGRPAAAALAEPGLAGMERCTALYVLAVDLARTGRNGEAVPLLRELVGLRRQPSDWLQLADCERALGNPDGEIEALASAARIDPRQPEVHAYLAAAYRARGRPDLAAWHQRRVGPAR